MQQCAPRMRLKALHTGRLTWMARVVFSLTLKRNKVVMTIIYNRHCNTIIMIIIIILQRKVKNKHNNNNHNMCNNKLILNKPLVI